MTPQKRALLVNWTLVIAAVAALVVVVVTERVWTSEELTARSEHLVVGFRAREVERIVVTAGDKRVVVERGGTTGAATMAGDLGNSTVRNTASDELGARWVATEPFQGEAEEAAVDSLLRAIEFATVLRQVPNDGFDRARAGLDTPAHVIELHLGSTRTRVRFGGQAPTPANARYVEVAGEGTVNKGVYVISATTADELRVAPDEFRIRQLVPYAASKLRSVHLRTPADPTADGPVQLELTSDEGLWTVELNGTSVRLAHSAWERLFAAFARSHADIILEPETARTDTPLGPEQIEVVLTPTADNQAAARLRFGGVCPLDEKLELAIRLEPEPLAACVKPLFLQSFLTEPSTLADLSLFSFQPDEVEEWTVTQDDAVLEVARRADGWIMRRPQAGLVERQLGNARLDQLLELSGELLAERPPATELLSEVRMRSGGESNQQVREQRVEVYLTQGYGGQSDVFEIIVRRLQDGAWLRLPARGLRLLTPDALLLKQTQVVELDAKAISGFSLRTAEWTQNVAVSDSGDVCRYRIPQAATVDRALCSDAVDALRNLRAQAWVSEQDTGEFGLQKPRVQAQVQTTTDAGYEIVVGALAVGGGYYARLQSDPAVFTVARSFVDTITTLMLDRSPFMLQPEKLEALTLVTPERTVTLRRLGQEFVQRSAAGDGSTGLKLSRGQIEAVMDALSLLRPEAAVALVGVFDAQSNRRYGFERPLLEVRPSDGTGWIVGAGDVYRDVSIFYARIRGSEAGAVFALPRQAVHRILDALSG